MRNFFTCSARQLGGQLSLLLILLLSASFAWADSGFYKDFVIVQAGGTTTYYTTYAGFAVPNPSFRNASLGTFSLAAGSPTLLLQGAEANTYEGNGALMQAARLYYRLYEQGTLPGSFQPMPLPYRYSGIDGNPNNKKWDRTDAALNLAQLAGRPGSFVLEVYFQAAVSYAGSTFQNYDSDYGANYRATFTVEQPVQPFVAPVYAEVDTTFHGKVRHVFGRLEPNRVNTGLLYDYALDLANLKNFDGSLLTDSTLVAPGVYGDLYTALYSSRFNSYAAGLRHPSIHDSLCYVARQRGVITLSGLLFRYNALDPQALAQGRIQAVNGQLLDQYAGGEWQNPYQTLTMLAISPSITTYSQTSCQVRLPSSLFLSNMGAQVRGIALDADDGRGYQPVQPDVPFALHYDSVGYKHWQFRVTLASGQQLYSHSRLYFDNVSDLLAAPASKGSAARDIIIDENFPVIATESYLGEHGVADVIISYHDANDQVLRKPLIVAEGLDPGFIVSPEKPEGENTFKGFINTVKGGGSNALRTLLSNDPSGYDIVYINWRNGMDYLQRNALVLEAVIREVNRRKLLANVTEPNVVLGSSMGGVIARMALGRMERAGGTGVNAHQTRLYVSLDAPHQGANVPLGYQAGARHAARLYVGVSIAFPLVSDIELVQLIRNRFSPLKTLFLADQPAARQLLTYRLNVIDQQANGEHAAFQQELKNTWAYPTSTRNVAISDGSECASDQQFTAGSTIFYNQRRIKSTFLGDIVGMLGSSGLGALGVRIPVVSSTLTVPGSSQLDATLEVKSLAPNGGNRVYYADVKYTKKLLWFLPITVTVANHSYTAPSGLLPLDSYPGGFYNVYFGEGAGDNTENWAFTYDNTFYIGRRFCFIPTPSALDIGQGNATLGAPQYLARYIGATPPAAPYTTPFSNFTTAFNRPGFLYDFDNTSQRPMINELHESLYLRTANWLAAELNGTSYQTNCALACANNNFTIQGSSLVCGTADFSIPNLPAGTTVTWSLPPGAASAFQLQPDVPGPGQVRVTNQGGPRVTTVLTATINGGTFSVDANGQPINCVSVEVSTPLSNDNSLSFPYTQQACTAGNVSHPSESGTCNTSNSTFVHQGCRVDVDLGPVPRAVALGAGAQPSYWGTSSHPYANTLYFALPLGSGAQSFRFNFPGSGGGCNDVSLVFFSFSNNGRYAYSASPNPTADEITVTASPKEAEAEPNASASAGGARKTAAACPAYMVEVYETSTGTRVMTQQNQGGDASARLHLTGLKPGYYLLHISDGESSQTIRIYKE